MPITFKQELADTGSSASDFEPAEPRTDKMHVGPTLDDIQGNEKGIDSLRIMIKAAMQRNEYLEPLLFICADLDYARMLAEAVSNELGTKSTTFSKIPTDEKAFLDMVVEIGCGEVAVFDFCGKLNKKAEYLLARAINEHVVTVKFGKNSSGREYDFGVGSFIPIFLTNNVRTFPEQLRKCCGAEFRWDYVPDQYFEAKVTSSFQKMDLGLNEESLEYLSGMKLSNSQLKTISARVKDFKDIVS